MTAIQQSMDHDLAQLPVRLYSALRTLRIYPPANPQVTRSTDHVLAILAQLLKQEDDDITVSVSEQKILVNGTPLSEKDHQRPQTQGLIELFSVLQIHTLTFHKGFTAADCVRFLELLSAATGSMTAQLPIKNLLQEAEIDSVSVDEKRYVAVHEGEQVVTEDQIGYGVGLKINDNDLAEFILNKAGGTDNGSSTILQQLFSDELNALETDTGALSSKGQETLKILLQGLEHAASAQEKALLLENSSTALAGLPPQLLAQMITALPEVQTDGELLDHTIDQLDGNQLEALLLQLTGQPGNTGRQAEKPLVQLHETVKTEEIEATSTRIHQARTLVELFQEPTPPQLKEQLHQPEWSAPLLVTAIRHLAGSSHDASTPEKFISLLSRYETELSAEKCEQISDRAGECLAALQDQELGKILLQRFKGIFGEQLYGTVISRMSADKFERIAQELNFLAQKKHAASGSSLDKTELQAAYERLMQSVRGEQLQALLTGSQEQTVQAQKIDPEQVRENIKQFLDGDHGVLTDDQVIQAIPVSVNRLLKNDKSEAADKLLVQMVTGLQHEDTEIRRGAAEALGRTIANLVQTEQWPRLDRLLPALEQALPYIVNPEAASLAVNALEKLTRHYISQQEYTNATNALNLLFNLTIRPPDNNPDMQQIAQIKLELLAEPSLLDPMFANIQAEGNESENCEYLISRMGAGSANYLMGKLSTSENREERELLLKLIGETGKPARDALLHLLQQEAPWYVTRNIIRLFQNIGDAGCFSTLAPFISHDDQRVQQEVIQTLGLIGGAARKTFFLNELKDAAEELKPLIIRQLGKIPDESIVLPLTELLQASAGPPVQAREQMQIEICVALARLGSKKALPCLKQVTHTKDIPGLEDYSPKILAAADSALKAISSGSTVLTANSEQQSASALNHLRARKHDPLAEKEASIFRLAARGATDAAIEALYDLIVSCAEQKDFANAERLRERIYEIDPMALTEIIRSGDIIEKEKTGAVSRDLLDTWSQLLEKLNTVEFGAIYHEFQERTFAPEETIIQQGAKNDELYFITQGSIKISYTNKEGRDIFVSSLSSGQIIGENFFNASLWTITLTALTSVKISVLQRESFQRWQEEYPGLEAKLQKFYDQCNITGQLLEKKGLDRREHERVKLSRKIQLQLTDHNRNPIGRGFRGELADISKGGLAFLIRISKKDNTRLLLGRNMRITIPVGGDPSHLHLDGLAIGIQPFQLMDSDFSVHIKFPELLNEDILQQILG